ncbi:polyprenyl synthetase family protein [Nocardia sp. BMG51109]|uniref:polyprenyl synthetase family protein n=1 Tax=Nocardia sp. BMG51109 TaxID=1056816 RepID=UPI000465DCBE|nr:polyprenyl synthetase family protein [Nocardia sp. BMG51109]
MAETVSVPVNTAAQQLMTEARQLCESALRDAVESLPRSLRDMARYHFGWCDRTGVPIRAGWGKGLRSALVFAAAAGCGADPMVAVPVAVAVELLHNFTLIHDDAIDGDRTRRGRATIWCVWGVSHAICLGDALHALAVRVLADALPDAMASRAVGLLESGALEVCGGQCADSQTIAAFDEFGRQLGLAFQISDDVLGIWGDPAVTGKPVGTDLLRRKRSFPVVAALASGTPASQELSSLYCADQPITEAGAARITALMEATGSRSWALQYAEQRVSAAIAALPDQMTTEDLTTLAGLIAIRES